MITDTDNDVAAHVLERLDRLEADNAELRSEMSSLRRRRLVSTTSSADETRGEGRTNDDHDEVMTRRGVLSRLAGAGAAGLGLAAGASSHFRDDQPVSRRASRRIHMRRSFGLCGLALIAALGFSTQVSADDGGRPLSATLTGAAEVSAGEGDPDGSGTATLRVHPGQPEICYQLIVADIAPAPAAHIHKAPAGTNGPVVVPLMAPSDGSSSACADVDRELATDIIKNPQDYYVNVHNAEFLSGAVRGQLSK